MKLLKRAIETMKDRYEEELEEVEKDRRNFCYDLMCGLKQREYSEEILDEYYFKIKNRERQVDKLNHLIEDLSFLLELIENNNQLEDVETHELVEELKGRTGVNYREFPPYARGYEGVFGSITELEIID